MIMAAAALLASVAVAAAPPAPSSSHQTVAQLVIRQGVIVRVPTRKRDRPVQWRERKGPKCIPADALAGALVSGPDSVDLLLRGGKRVRAELESRCPALDYYSGFYIRPGRDGQVCQDRDAIHARSGGKCEIDRFRSLVPKR
jgi:hypothetical protein